VREGAEAEVREGAEAEVRDGAEAEVSEGAEVKGSRSEVSISSDSLSHTTELTYTFAKKF
jgi:hypothetical protein